MAKLPNPPAVEKLRDLGPELVHVTAGMLIWRVYFRAGQYPTRWKEFRKFGPVSSSRFDHHVPPAAPQERGILYAAARGPTCIAEVFQETRTIDRAARSPWVVGFELVRDLVLHDLTGTWCTRAGASMAIHSGRRDRTRLWSRAMYEAYPEVDGLRYCSSMDGNNPAFALYERAESALARRPVFHRALRDPVMLTAIANAANEFAYVVL